MRFDTDRLLRKLLFAAEMRQPWATPLVDECGGVDALKRLVARPKRPRCCPSCGVGNRIAAQRHGPRRLTARDRRPTIPGAWRCRNCDHHWRTDGKA